jgi:thymidylate synthase (FAD)
LLSYCIKNKHWSIFEMANMCVEITASRAITAQILRHRSFSFQEFSQRYAEATNFVNYEARRQDTKNRQNSIDNMSKEDLDWFREAQVSVISHSSGLYEEALSRGIAKEQARFLLPLSTESKIYMNGSIRSWIHYLDLRCGNGTQLEHKKLADQIKLIFIKEFPIISESLAWS